MSRPLVSTTRVGGARWWRMMKRVMDIILVLLLTPVWVPLMGLVAVPVALKLGRPVLFRQERPGLNGKIFVLCKFRSMLDSRDSSGQLRADSERLTPFGRRLRSTSLDELPELWNVLKGDMSLVGPRPLMTHYLPRYTEQQARRHEVRPGLTGWAQIQGRNALSWEERLALDVWYVNHRSLWLDMVILWRTVRTVLVREGISAAGEATMTEFMGSPPGTPEPKLLVDAKGKIVRKNFIAGQ